jgi:Tfp pilus assembly protein PilV
MNRLAPRRQGRPSRDEHGSTLVEVLIASVIMGSAVIVLVTGLGTLFASSIQNRESTTAGVIARSYAEALVVAVNEAGAWCSPTYTVDYTPPGGWNGYSVAAAPDPCPPTTPANTPQFQTVTITATTPKGSTETLRMVVRKP